MQLINVPFISGSLSSPDTCSFHFELVQLVQLPASRQTLAAVTQFLAGCGKLDWLRASV